MKTLHITGGTCLLNDIKKESQDTYISFNEAMCFGNANEEIFSNDFIKQRCYSLNSTKEEYQKIVLEPLKPLHEQIFDVIELYFGKDMFCQINLLTLLAYFEQIQLHSIIYVNEVDENANVVISRKETRLGAYLESYIQLVCHQKMPQNVKNKAYEQYLNYEDIVCDYIKKNIHKNNLLEDLMKHFSYYGLGDTQYEELIHKVQLIIDFDTN